MKKLLALLLALVAVFSLCACGGAETEGGEAQGEEAPKMEAPATEAEIAKLEEAYAGLTVFHGQMHDHANTGRRSDGKASLQEWTAVMPEVGMDFAAILDHRQTDHMYLDVWDPIIFVCGSEAMTHVGNRPDYCNKYHYNMILPNVEAFEEHLNQFPLTYRFIDGLFEYIDMSEQTFLEVIDSVLEKAATSSSHTPSRLTPSRSAGMILR